MAHTFDFIVVGGGTAGCLLAHRLANTQTKPSVLLAEAGPNPEGGYLRAPFHRFLASVLRPDLDHGFTSTPQKALNNRTIQYTRGKGLGGSSILNFAVYLYGSKEDFNRWADLVGDESWKWEKTQKAFQAIEAYDFQGAKKYSHLANPKPEDHGSTGAVKVSLPPVLEDGYASALEALIKNGEKINLDANSGDPTGISIFPGSYSSDGRTTSATAHLVNAPDNLTIWTGAAVRRLNFAGTKVNGIETADGRKAQSGKEVIVCAGSIDSPKLLLLSGIGPRRELEEHGIEVVKDLGGVGKNLHDHVLTFLSVEIDGTQNSRYAFESNENMVLEADAQWKKDRSGPMALHVSGLFGGFPRIPELKDFQEYKDLDASLQDYLAKESVPAYEFCGNALLFPPGTPLSEGNSYLTVCAFLMNPQSEGSVTLRSGNAEDKPVIELAYMQHPYDRRLMREAVRGTWTKVFENPDLKPLVKRRLYGPETLSDEDIDAFVKEAATTVWHANGTAKMGKKDDPSACVDPEFRVYGVEGLRVADLSVCPLTPNNHTQSTAYLVGYKAAEALIKEYSL